MSSPATPLCPAFGIRCPDSGCPADCSRRKIADRLQELSGNVLCVKFSSGTYREGDEGSKDHLYNGFPAYGNEVDSLYMDDRGPESLEVQLVAELRRVGEYYLGLAETVEKKITT